MDAILLSKKEFYNLKNLIYSSSGIILGEGKSELLKSKIAKRMRITKKPLKDYLDFLNSDVHEIVEFIDTVTTNHSFFFRENKCIEYIIDQFIKNPQKDKKQFNLWCAACSTGDEPYSVAVQLKHAGLKFSILATDLSHSVLDIAANGIYKKDKLKYVPLPIIRQYFQQGTGDNGDYIKVKKEIRQHIRFQKFNLIRDIPSRMDFDAVLCRNVMIYFDLTTSEKVVNKLYGSILPGGFFAIGSAETLINMDHQFCAIPKTPSLYRKQLQTSGVNYSTSNNTKKQE